MLLELCACITVARIVSAASLFPNGTRNKYNWPFSSHSFWNTAIGSGAKYAFANITAAQHVTVDPDWFLVVPPHNWSMVPWFAPHSWDQRCGESERFFGWVKMAPDQIVPDATMHPHSTPNNAAAILQPDGETILNTNPIARCVPNGPLFGGQTPAGLNQSIYGVGQYGGHGGSGLSSIGGTVRRGELLPGSGPILHALKWEFWGAKFYFKPPSGNSSDCFQWPAMRCDSYWQQKYGGELPFVRPGALLAIPPDHEAAVNATLTTEPGRMLLRALVDFGAYIVSDTAWDAQQFCIEHGLQADFEAAWGLSMSGTIDKRQHARKQSKDAFLYDVTALSEAMHAVVNSAEDTIGGGGTPKVPPPPPIGN